MVRTGWGLNLNFFQPGVFSRRLIEMAMNTKILFHFELHNHVYEVRYHRFRSFTKFLLTWFYLSNNTFFLLCQRRRVRQNSLERSKNGSNISFEMKDTISYIKLSWKSNEFCRKIPAPSKNWKKGVRCQVSVLTKTRPEHWNLKPEHWEALLSLIWTKGAGRPVPAVFIAYWQPKKSLILFINQA